MRDECVGGEGTGGGTSRRREGDLLGAAAEIAVGTDADPGRLLVLGMMGGWYPSRGGGRYRSILAIARWPKPGRFRI